jgi:hypothetical protein
MDPPHPLPHSRAGRKPLLSCLILLVAFFTLSATAEAEIFNGTATDPVDPGVEPGRDIVAVSVSYSDKSGLTDVHLTTAGPPVEANTFALGTVGTPDGAGGCGLPAVSIGHEYDGGSTGVWRFGSSTGPASVSVSGNSSLFTAYSSAFAGQGFRCATVQIFQTEANGSKTVLKDTLAAPFPLTGLVPPPPAPSPPSPPTPKRVKLRLKVPDFVALPRNKWGSAKVTIPNAGSRGAAKVTLRVGKVKGVAVKPKSGKMPLGKIAPGEAVTVTFPVRLGPRAKRISKLPLSVTDKNGLQVKTKLVLKVRKK